MTHHHDPATITHLLGIRFLVFVRNLPSWPTAIHPRSGVDGSCICCVVGLQLRCALWVGVSTRGRGGAASRVLCPPPITRVHTRPRASHTSVSNSHPVLIRGWLGVGAFTPVAEAAAAHLPVPADTFCPRRPGSCRRGWRQRAGRARCRARPGTGPAAAAPARRAAIASAWAQLSGHVDASQPAPA